jgi:hypothetical protein
MLTILLKVDEVGARRLPFKRDAPWAVDVDTVAPASYESV